MRDIEVIRSNGLWEFDGLGEAYFSWQECEGCKSDVGGNRYDLVFKYSLDDTEVYTISLCEECMHYIFGDEVDLLEKHTEDISIR